jgi:uncharacterized protein DUF3592
MPQLPWYVYLMLLAPLGLILFAAVYKTLQVRAAREWPSAPGKVVISNSEVRQVRVLDETHEEGHHFEPRNFANIVYEYSVSGEILTNNRVSIAEDRGNSEIAETIARYPVGKAVTVYFNPRHPRDAVLERDLPQGLWGCLGIGTIVVLVILFGSVFGINQFNDFIARQLADPKLSPLVVVFLAFGFFIALFALAMRKQASLAKQWPVVPGTIHMSDVETYRAAPDRASRGPIMYQRQASYSYTFNNVAYSNVDATFATGAASTSGWLARRFTAAYQDGASVDVYVNPLNPSEATLNPRGGRVIIWILSLLSAAFFAGAYFVARAG